jgi:hypothetical protein
MPGTTAYFGFPFQESGDPPDGAALGQDLAEAVEDALSQFIGELTFDRGVTELETNSSTWDNDESGALITHAPAYPITEGQNYKISVGVHVSTTSPGGGAVVGPPTNETCMLRIRQDTSTGDLLAEVQHYIPNTSTVGHWKEFTFYWTADADYDVGEIFFVLTGERTTSAGSADHQIKATSTRKGYIAAVRRGI